MNKYIKNGIITIFALLALGYSEKSAELDRAIDDYNRYIKKINKTASMTYTDDAYDALRDRLTKTTAEMIENMEKIAQGDAILMERVKGLKEKRENMLYIYKAVSNKGKSYYKNY